MSVQSFDNITDKLFSLLLLNESQPEIVTPEQKETITSLFQEMVNCLKLKDEESNIDQLRDRMLIETDTKKIFSICLRKCPDSMISSLLGLDKWKSCSLGDTNIVCQRIIECFKTQSTSLDLSHSGLRSLPKCLFKYLTQLQHLNCSNNQLVDLSSEIGQCTQLQTLNCSNNRLSSLPSELGQCTQLQQLIYDNNSLNGLPETLFRFDPVQRAEIGLKKLKEAATEPLLKNLDVSFFKNNSRISENVLYWLNILITSEEFTDPKSRLYFAERVLGILQFAKDNPEYFKIFKKYLLKILETSSAEPSFLSVNNLEVQKRIHGFEDASLENLIDIISDVFKDSAAVKTEDKKEIFFIYLKKCPDLMISSLLGLDKWNPCNDADDRNKARQSIIECFKTQSTSLDLSRNSLSSLPKCLKYFTQLKKINCRDNHLTSLPSEIGQCVQLQELNCSNNKLISLPSEIGQCTQLQELDFSYNKLTSLPSELRQYTQLQGLDFSYNELMNLPIEIGQCTQLKKFNCANNKLTSLPSEIGQCTQLQNFTCDSNKLTSLPSEIGQCTQLQELYCSWNKLTSLPSEIGQCTQLRVLNYQHNDQLGDLPEKLSRFMPIEEQKLRMDFIKFKDAVTESSLKNLDVKFFIRDFRIFENVSKWLSRLTTIEEFTDLKSRPYFAGRVLDILQFAKNNPEYFETLKAHLFEVSKISNDKLSFLSVNNLEVQKRIHESMDTSLENLIDIFVDVFKNTSVLEQTLPLNSDGTFVNKKEMFFIALEKCPDSMISSFLGLNKWNSGNPWNEACNRISTCFRTQSSSLNLSAMDLRSLPECLKYFTQLQRLEIQNNELTNLPSGIGQCVQLRELDCSRNRLTHLPSELGQCVQLRELDCSRNRLTHLPSELGQCVQLEHLNYSNNQINGLPETLSHFDPIQQQQREGLRQFKGAVTDPSLKNLDENFFKSDPAFFKNLLEWLILLTTAKEFTNPKSCPYFAERVLSILQFAQTSPEYLEEVLKLYLIDALASCVDRASLPLNYLEVQKKIHESKDDSLKNLIVIFKGSLALEQILLIAFEFMKSHPDADEIEVHLGFQTKFKKIFNLPIALDSMNFFACSHIEDKDLINAETRIKKVLQNKENVVNCLISHKIWIGSLKKELKKDFDLDTSLSEIQEKMEKLLEDPSGTSQEFKVACDALKDAYGLAEKAWVLAKTIEIVDLLNDISN